MRYKALREELIDDREINLVTRLGPAAFQDMNWWAATTSLLITSNTRPNKEHKLAGLDVSNNRNPAVKIQLLHETVIYIVSQSSQKKNPDARIQFEETEDRELLTTYANGLQGISTADLPRFVRNFWEFSTKLPGWEFYQGSAHRTMGYAGRESVIALLSLSEVSAELGAAVRGRKAWGRRGIVVRQMRHLPVTLYTGEPFDTNVAVILPKNDTHLAAIWCFCSSPEYHVAVRKIDQKTNVTNATLVKVPFDHQHWEKIAKEQYPSGLPKPHSDDPTQWLFKGDISSSNDPLQVAMGRMLGYCWPEQPKEQYTIDALADKDGIVCIPAVRGEEVAAERLLDVLRTAYGSEWSSAIVHKLLTDAECRPGASLEDWMREKFFEQQCKGFHHRPFIWHIWDGRKDGFSCLVNYHKLDHKRLETLTYSYLQDWIIAQAAAAKEGRPGADLRLAAAQELQNKLKLILEGEPPYDIFVRWKQIQEQPIGWNPDLNDGVRVNIRPFVIADVLRRKPNIDWKKDRGKEPECDRDEFPWFWENGTFKGDRINDYHLTNAQKHAAREQANHG